MSPVIDATELRLLRIAYRRALGVPDEDSGKELVERIQEHAPPGSQVALEGTWAAAYAEREPNPFAVLGGMGG